MTADIRAAALAQARTREAHEAFSSEHWTRVFVAGAVWGAVRVTPTREQIAEEMEVRGNGDS